MVEQITAIVKLVFANPLQGFFVLLALLFIYLYIRKTKSTERLRLKLDEERGLFYIELFTFLNQVLRNNINFDDVETKTKLSELDSKLKLFSSDKVVLAWADFWNALFKSGLENKEVTQDDYKFFLTTLEAYGYLQIAIRKDMGSSSFISALKWFDYSRSLIKDLDNNIDQNLRGYRSVEMKKYNIQSSSQNDANTASL